MSATASAAACRSTPGVPATTRVNAAPRDPVTGNRPHSPSDELAAARLAGLDRLHRVRRHVRAIDTTIDERKAALLAELVETLNGEHEPRERVRLFREVSALRDALDVGGAL